MVLDFQGCGPPREADYKGEGNAGKKCSHPQGSSGVPTWGQEVGGGGQFIEEVTFDLGLGGSIR